jgi:uncharacterized membrane protein YphA (DoxX/SURF4 family)
MKKSKAFHILRLGLGITFLWIGVLILQSPSAWAAFISPWAARFIPMSLQSAMIGAGILDVAVGFFLIVNIFTWLAGFVGAAHLLMVLLVSGFNPDTIRDIGLLGAALYAGISTMPGLKRK